MTKPVYEWKWKRANHKHFLVLTKNGKKVASAIALFEHAICPCCQTYMVEYYPESYPALDTPRFIGYVGGKKLPETHKTMAEAKIAVEKALGVSTAQEKVLQPERVR